MADNANYTRIPTSEVSLSLLCRVLGVRSNSVPIVLGSKNISKIARRKPYKNIGSWGTQLYGASGNDETLIIQNNFGLTPTVITIPEDSVAPITDGSKKSFAVMKWGQWSPPDPYDTNDFKRMDDMLGYYKIAEPHIAGLVYTDPWGEADVPALTHNGKFKVELSFNKAADSVRLDEIHYGTDLTAKYGDKYLTVVITNKNSVRWGMDWIVVQAKATLGSVVRDTTGTTRAGTYTLEFNLSNVTSASSLFSSYFLAVGLADKFTKATVANQQTVTSYQNSNTNADIWLFRYNASNYPTVTKNRMPLTLYSFNMFGERINEAMLGTIQSVQGTQIRTYFDVPAYISVSHRNMSNTYFSAKFVTKNGVAGVEVLFYCNVQASVNMSGIDSDKRDKGYPAFVFYVQLLDPQTNEILNDGSYAVVFAEGWRDNIELGVNGTTLEFYPVGKGEATTVDAGTLKSLNNATLLKNGIFLPCSKSSVVVGACVDVKGGEQFPGDAVYCPWVVKYKPYSWCDTNFDFGEVTISK